MTQQRGRKRERDIIRPGGANGRPDIPKKAGFTEEMSQHIQASTKSISQKPDDLTTKTENIFLISEDEEECEGTGKNQGGGMLRGILHPHPSFFIETIWVRRALLPLLA